MEAKPGFLEVCWVPVLKISKPGCGVHFASALACKFFECEIFSYYKWKKPFDEFQKKWGIAVLRRLEYPKAVKAGHMMPVKMWWFNAGVAPVYHDYSLDLEFRSADARGAVHTFADIRKWLPGDSIYESTLHVPEMLRPGKYRVRIALRDLRTGQPAIRLAIEGREADGWYDLGAIIVE
jgi:hypothetical protein